MNLTAISSREENTVDFLSPQHPALPALIPPLPAMHLLLIPAIMHPRTHLLLNLPLNLLALAMAIKVPREKLTMDIRSLRLSG